MTLTRDEVFARAAALFGPTWQRPFARAWDMEVVTVNRGKPPTLRFILAVVEVLELLPPTRWPGRYAELEALARSHASG